MDTVVVEHIFVTTLEPAAAVAATGQLLSRHKFTAAGRQGFTIGSNLPTSAEFVRVKKSQFMRLTNANQLNRAQKVRLDFDRGRVTVAAAMDDANATDLTTSQSRFQSRKGRRLAELQQLYLIGIANALEAHLARGEPLEVAERSIAGPVAEIEEIGRRSARNALIIVGIIMLLIAGFITIAVMASNN